MDNQGVSGGGVYPFRSFDIFICSYRQIFGWRTINIVIFYT